jgi:hypothetical protein
MKLDSLKIGDTNEDDSFFKKNSMDVGLYKPPSLDEVDNLVKKFMKVNDNIC